MQNHNIKSQTISSDAKKYHKTARRLRGSTVVPVLIGVAVATGATMLAMNEGAQISESANAAGAQQQIARMLSDWNTLTSNAVPNNITNGPDSMTEVNVYGATGVFNDNGNGNAATFEYATDSNDSCNLISGRLSTDMDGIGAVNCAGANNAVLTITLN
jgi:hypothetical protein